MEKVNLLGWELKLVSELIEDFERGISYSSEDIVSPDGIPLMNLACVDKTGFYRPNRLKFYSGEYSDSQKIFPNDMLVACTDMTREAEIIGTPILVPDEADFLLYTMDLALLKPKESVCPMFLYYALKTKYYRKYIKPWASGTNVLHLNLKGIYDYKLYIPKQLAEQERIGKVLASIDRKIELNKAINANLEAMAKQLYDYWFVQFDFPDANGRPYKSSGGKMLYNPKLKREIPIDWHCGSLLDIAEYTNGLACQRYRPREGEGKLPVIKIREMHEGISSDTEFVKEDIPECLKVYDGDVLFSWSASLEVMLWAYGRGGLNQHIFKVTSKNKFPRSFFYYQLCDYVIHFKKIAEARKTTMGHITQDHLRLSTIAIPDDTAEADKLEQILHPIFDRIIANYKEIRDLTALRDSLLPMLMNGQVSVS